MTDFRAREDEIGIRWVMLGCPSCSTRVMALEAVSLPTVFCSRSQCAFARLTQVDP